MSDVVKSPTEQDKRALTFLIDAYWRRVREPGHVQSADEAHKLFDNICARMHFRDMFFLDLDAREKLVELLAIMKRMIYGTKIKFDHEAWSSILTDEEGANFLERMGQRIGNHEATWATGTIGTTEEEISRISQRVSELLDDPRLSPDASAEEYGACLDDVIGQITTPNMKGFAPSLRVMIAMHIASSNWGIDLQGIISRDEWVELCPRLFAGYALRC